MSYEWGRAPEAGRWQRAVPVWLMSVMLMAVASGAGMWWFRQTFVWTPLQQFYLSEYARSAGQALSGELDGLGRSKRLRSDSEISPNPSNRDTVSL